MLKCEITADVVFIDRLVFDARYENNVPSPECIMNPLLVGLKRNLITLVLAGPLLLVFYGVVTFGALLLGAMGDLIAARVLGWIGIGLVMLFVSDCLLLLFLLAIDRLDRWSDEA